MTLWDNFTGRMAAPETVALRARVSGYIDKVAFEEGELVKQGDVLFVIDQRPYQARLQMARAEVARARSQVTLAAREAERAEQLWERRAISREEMEQRSAARTMAQAALASAEAAQDNAELDLAYTEVKAPVSGRMGRAEITKGNLATADATLLATLVSVDPLYVYFESDQQTAEAIRSMMRAAHRFVWGWAMVRTTPIRGSSTLSITSSTPAPAPCSNRAVIATPRGGPSRPVLPACRCR
ncbi:efflux RND transporter periplasmic adaptor subunit [Halopseudomonas pachastrellae]|nr:efflux RND transporter periplasmic adaptor subunit [Halopseudomonas pachastrellae]